ncbi:MAG: hypothetical protein NTV08_07095 [Verrucomicrobia bacterium]|nr:hypothetical protein [Verrucomicrobiota bacterium]
MKFDLKSSIINMMRDPLHAVQFQPFMVVWVIYDDSAKVKMLNPTFVAVVETKVSKVVARS